jgi:hypothetical protein
MRRGDFSHNAPERLTVTFVLVHSLRWESETSAGANQLKSGRRALPRPPAVSNQSGPGHPQQSLDCLLENAWRPERSDDG